MFQTRIIYTKKNIVLCVASHLKSLSFLQGEREKTGRKRMSVSERREKRKKEKM